MADIGAPMEPFVALALPTMLDKCSDKVPARHGLSSSLASLLVQGTSCQAGKQVL
jgi:hypothetical protein